MIYYFKVFFKANACSIKQSLYDQLQHLAAQDECAKYNSYVWCFKSPDVLLRAAELTIKDGYVCSVSKEKESGFISEVWKSDSGKALSDIFSREESPSVKYYNISNEKFEKQVETCAYCGCQRVTIVRKDGQSLSMDFIPNDPQRRLVCRTCQRHTQMSVGGYGFDRHPSKFVTPIDASNTVILGLEQEFEGYFYGWLELQRAHQGMLKYGYDSSIATDERKEYHSRDSNNGKNELSWDCGSYSWWKYASPLKNVCETVKKYGGREGNSAGVHIHASFYQQTTDQTKSIARRCFELLQSRKDIQNLMLIVSGRSRERLDRWAFIDEVSPESREFAENGGPRKALYTDHHSCISFNQVGSIEFRCFSACLDHKLILKRMKFVKEYVTLIKNKTNPNDFIKSFSAGVKEFIRESQKAQLERGNVTAEQFVL